MSLGELIVACLEALDEIVDQVVTLADRTTDPEPEPDEQNTPPVTPSAKAIESWPTEAQHERRAPETPFQGHPVPLGGGR